MSAALAHSILLKLKKPIPLFIKHRTKNPSLDLNGTTRKFSSWNKSKVKYARHIPYLKEANLRVELSNHNSDFKK
jgi:hypothetical protein